MAKKEKEVLLVKKDQLDPGETKEMMVPLDLLDCQDCQGNMVLLDPKGNQDHLELST